ncbi:MAG: histidine phosphatase family protein [Anaerolineae bacterium]
MTETFISLIRHGETPWNRAGRWQGHAAVPLNEEGLEQARLLGAFLQPRAAEFSAIYTSDLTRAKDTAQAVSERLRLPLIPDRRLREIDVGEWQGLTGDEIREWDSVRFEEIQRDPYGLQRPGGESLNQVAERSIAALREYVVKHAGGHVIVVTHGGTIRTILQHLAVVGEGRIWVDNTSLTVLHHLDAPESWRLDTFNSLEHLGIRRVVPGSDG